MRRLAQPLRHLLRPPPRPADAQVEAFLQRWRNQEAASLDEFQLDGSVLWKRKKPASFEGPGAHPPRTLQRPPQGPARGSIFDSDDDEADFLGPAEQPPDPAWAGQAQGPGTGGLPGFGQFRFAGPGAPGAQPAPELPRAPASGSQAGSQSAAPAPGSWHKSGWRRQGESGGEPVPQSWL